MQQAANALSTWNPGSLSDEPAVPETWIEAIFTRLSAQLGTKVADLWGGVPPETVKTEWAEALSSFDPTEISRGLKACQTRAFAPTLGEFLRLCRPSLDPEIAWLEAAEGMAQRAHGQLGEWSHPAVYRAASGFEHELRSGSFAQHRKSWTWRLEREMRKGWLLGVPKPMQALGNNPTTRGPTPEEWDKLRALRDGMRLTPPRDDA